MKRKRSARAARGAERGEGEHRRNDSSIHPQPAGETGAGAQSQAALSALWTGFFDQTKLGVALIDKPTDTFLRVNETFARERDYAPGELVGRPVADVLPEEIRAEARGRMEAETGEHHVIYETRHLRKDGTIIPILVEVIQVPASEHHPELRALLTLDQTERNRLAEALLTSSEQLEQLFEVMPVGVALLDRKRNIVKMNAALSEITDLSMEGYQKGEHFNFSFVRPDGSVLPPDQFPSNRIIRGEPNIREEEIGLVNKNGSITWASICASRPPDPDHGAILVLQDITTQKATQRRGEYFARLYRTLCSINRAIARTTNQEELFREICKVSVEHGHFSLAWIGLFDGSGERVTTASFAAAEKIPQSLPLPGFPVRPDDPGIFAECMRTGGTVFCEDILSDPVMQPTPETNLYRGALPAYVIPLKIHERLIGFLMLQSIEASIFKLAEERDLPEELRLDLSFALEALDARARRIEATRLMAESEAKYRSLVDATDATVFVLDEEGKIRFLNPNAARLYGTTQAEGIGRDMEEFLAPEHAKERLELVREVIESGKSASKQTQSIINGKAYWFQTTISPIAHSTKAERLATVVSLDISSQKELEESLRQAKEQAERSDRLKEAFIASMSHEIRTPLNIILGFASLLEESLSQKLNPEQHTYFVNIHRGTDRLVRTIDQILTISRLRAGEFTISPSRFDLAAVIRQIVDESRPMAMVKSLGMIFRNEYGSAWMTGDRVCLSQALSNIVDNAIKYSEHGEITVRMYPGADRRLCVQVTDNGIGISREYLPHIFEAFSQEETGYCRPYEGIGLGLAITKQYLDLHNVRINVRSEKNIGTIVTLLFGADIPTEVQSPASAAAPPVHAAKEEEPASPRARILLVEDDPLSIELVRAFLAGVHDLRVATDAETAWDILRSTKIDLVLMDISIQGSTNGLDLTREIRASGEFPTLPVIALTAHAFMRDRENSLEAGCDDFIAKPVGRTSLLDRIGTHLRRQTAAA